jgi:hypothetical protein
MFIREDMATINVALNGVPFGATWKEVEGGNLEADVGMGREVSAGGPASRTDLTVRTNMTDVVASWLPSFENEVGVGDVAVTINWLDRRRGLIGVSTTRKGILQAANVPNTGTGSDVGMFEIVVDCNEQTT